MFCAGFYQGSTVSLRLSLREDVDTNFYSKDFKEVIKDPKLLELWGIYKDMAKYIALKDFYKVSEDKNYKVGDSIELLEDTAAPLLLGGFVVAVKIETKKVKK